MDVTSGISKQQVVFANIEITLEVIDVSFHVTDGHMANEWKKPSDRVNGRPHNTVSTEKSSIIDHPQHIVFEQTYGNLPTSVSTSSLARS